MTWFCILDSVKSFPFQLVLRNRSNLTFKTKHVGSQNGFYKEKILKSRV